MPLGGSSLADLEAGEPPDVDAGLVEDRLDRLLRVLHRRLVEQRDLLEVAVQPTLDDLGQRLLRLALLTGGGLGDLALLGHNVRGDLVAGDVARAHRRDLHGGAASDLTRVRAVAVELHQHADGRRQVGRTAVHVRRDGAVEDRDPTELDLLADLDREPGDDLTHGGVAERHGLERLQVGRLRLGGGIGDLLGGGHELVALRDEVGLAVHLDQGGAGGGDQPGGGGALGAPLLGLRGTLDAEDLDGLVEVAVSLLKCLLAVHHARAGDVAELLDVGGGDVRHVCALLRAVGGGLVGARRARGTTRAAPSKRRPRRAGQACGSASAGASAAGASVVPVSAAVSAGVVSAGAVASPTAAVSAASDGAAVSAASDGAAVSAASDGAAVSAASDGAAVSFASDG